MYGFSPLAMDLPGAISGVAISSSGSVRSLAPIALDFLQFSVVVLLFYFVVSSGVWRPLGVCLGNTLIVRWFCALEQRLPCM